MHAKECRKEAVQAAIEDEPAQALAAEGAKRAAAVVDRLARQRVTHEIGDARGDAPEPGVGRAALHAPARGGVPAVELGEEPRNVIRVVLEIGVHHHDEAPARGLEARVGRRRLARIRLQAHEPHAPVRRAELADDLGAAVTAPIVHEDDLDREPEAVEHRAELMPERRQARFLVVDGNDDREVKHPARPSPGGSSPAIRRRACAGGQAGRGPARSCG